MARKFAYLTPSTIPNGSACRPVFIPDSEEWLAVVSGALAELTRPYNWEQAGGVTVEAATERAALMLKEYYEGVCQGEETIPTPFWDEDTTADDEQTLALQDWYGEVSSFLAPIDNLSFVQNAAVWGITGFVAYAAGIAPAIAFRTVARNFVLAIQREDVGEAIRVVVNGVQETRVDTTPYAVGEVFEVPIATETGAEFYDVTIIGGGTQ